MRTIEIEDDVYEYLRQHTNQIGETASQIIRRELGILKTSGPVVGVFSECLNSSTFITKRTVVDKFLCILSYVHKRDPKKFKKVLEISGWRRKYFALSSKELEESGNSVQPKQIPDSPFWVITTADTPKKKRMLREVLELIEYRSEDVEQAVEALI